MTGKIFDIHRLSTHDGPGMRTTVFMKGCSLKCSWCHNPESIHSYDELQWLHNKCIACGACVKACNQGALNLGVDGISIDREKCNRCMACVSACPTGAMNKLGENRTVEAIMEEVLQDRLFYENSGGGVTISGGEALLQPVFVLALLKKLKEAHIHTAIDTCLNVNTKALKSVIPYVDLWLVDLKETNPTLQQTYLGATDEKVKENFDVLIDQLGQMKRSNSDCKIDMCPKVWIRTPLIPTATAREDNIKAIATYLNKIDNSVIELWELCTFNNLCGDKYNKLGLDWEFDGVELLTNEEKQSFGQLAKEVANDMYKVKVSGLTR